MLHTLPASPIKAYTGHMHRSKMPSVWMLGHPLQGCRPGMLLHGLLLHQCKHFSCHSVPEYACSHVQPSIATFCFAKPQTELSAAALPSASATMLSCSDVPWGWPADGVAPPPSYSESCDLLFAGPKPKEPIQPHPVQAAWPDDCAHGQA